MYEKYLALIIQFSSEFITVYLFSNWNKITRTVKLVTLRNKPKKYRETVTSMKNMHSKYKLILNYPFKYSKTVFARYRFFQ